MLSNTPSKQTKLFSLIVQEIENFGPGWQARKDQLHPPLPSGITFIWHDTRYFKGKCRSLAQKTGILISSNPCLSSQSEPTFLPLAEVRKRKSPCSFPVSFPQIVIPTRKMNPLHRFLHCGVFVQQKLMQQLCYNVEMRGWRQKKGGRWSQSHPIPILKVLSVHLQPQAKSAHLCITL